MSTLFYRNPRLLLLTLALITVSGIFAFRLLPRLEDPVMAERFAMVKTIFPSASPERVEALLTEKIEEALQEVEEIKTLESTSSAGFSMIQIELVDEVSFDTSNEVWSRVRDKLNDVRPELPEEANEPIFEEVNAQAYALIAGLAWETDGEPRYGILRRLTEELETRLRTVPGTKDIDYFGEPEEEIRVEVNQTELSALGLTAEELSDYIRESDAKISAGQQRSTKDDLLIEPETELDSLERLRQIPLQPNDDGELVSLADIAEVHKGIVEPVSSRVYLDGQPAVALGVYVESDQRIDVWAAQAREIVEQYATELPVGVRLNMIFDQSTYTADRLDTLIGNLILGAAAVFVVIFILMGWRSALLVGLSLPLSSLMVLTGMRLWGIPIHQMSITGLIIALGLLIDNAIVVVDEMNRRLHKGMSVLAAIQDTVGQLSIPLLGSTLTTMFAFMPIALMPGPAGEFVGSIALSVILALFSSLFVSLTIIPALNGLINHVQDRLEITEEPASSASQGNLALANGPPLPHLPEYMQTGEEHLAERENAKHGPWWKQGLRLPRVTDVFSRFLNWVLAYPVVGILLAIVGPILGFAVFPQLPEQFFPPADRDQFHIEFELSPQASLHQTEAAVLQVQEQLLDHPEIKNVHWFLGRSAPNFYYNIIQSREQSSRYAHAIIQLDSSEGSRDLIHELQEELDRRWPGSRTIVRQLEQGPPFEAPVEYRIYGPDLERLKNLGDEARRILARADNVLHTRAVISEDLPKIGLEIDEVEARLLGMNHTQIAEQMNGALEGFSGGSILEATEELPVRVRVSGTNRSRLAEIMSLDLVKPVGDVESDQLTTVPLSVLAKANLIPESAGITRHNRRRVNTVQGFIKAGVLPAEVVADFTHLLEENNFTLPPGYKARFGGEAAERDNAVGNLMASVGMLMVLMISTLVLSFNSFRLAGMILVVAALAVGPGLGSLWVAGYPFGFMAIIGTMGLVGVAINDSIVVLAALRADDRARNGDVEAVHHIVMDESRHVLATTITTIAGFLPLLIAGGGFWPPLAIAISGGVSAATIMALLFIPCSYLLMTRFSPKRFCDQRKTAKGGESPARRKEELIPQTGVAVSATT
ncbi:Cobalt-zinc-cadmium resistance protein CzcA [Polystyrenella longa]|uniref:Cobalt-zinc-cadmium resistance protein CzcA n=1 Tax=Polystyrenella longa TaxID=2528007 RepID=A0A518CRE0_9PLAN|nr:efflux RND transporter permease subunit [Polystyrenella longa]QDU81783.1 Cobalt-zinc-cadmium resistance protein CzcA [Polystyrenella longa]